LATATAARIRAEGNLISSRANYRRVIGDAPRDLQPANAPQAMPVDEEEAMRLSLTNDPDVIAAEYDTRSSVDNIDEVRGELLPSVNLQGTASTALETSAQGSRAESYEALVILNVPFYEKGAVYSRLREAKQQAGQFRVLVDIARRNAIEEVTLSWEALQTARAQTIAFQTAIQAAAVALEGVQREQEVGSRTLLDVLNAEQELLDARVNLVSAQRDETVAAYRLKAAVGQLTARQLGLAVELYDPAVHYEEVRGKWIGGGSSGEYEVRDLQ
jgi:outer membrane protein